MTSNNQNEKKDRDMTAEEGLKQCFLDEVPSIALIFRIMQWHKEQRKAWALGLVPREMPEKTVCWWLKNVKKSDACVKGYNGFREQMIKRIKGE